MRQGRRPVFSRRAAHRRTRELRLELPPDTCVTPRSRRSPSLSGAYSPSRDDWHARVHRTDAVDHRQREPGGRVHREEKGDERRIHHRGRGEPFFPEIDTDHVEPGILEPCRRGRQPERLTAHVYVRSENRHPSLLYPPARFAARGRLVACINRL